MREERLASERRPPFPVGQPETAGRQFNVQTATVHRLDFLGSSGNPALTGTVV
jgi:hypothetical protein